MNWRSIPAWVSEPRFLFILLIMHGVSLIVWAVVSVVLVFYMSQIFEEVKDWHYGMMDPTNPAAMLAPAHMNRMLTSVYSLANTTSQLLDTAKPQAEQALLDYPEAMSGVLGYVQNMTKTVKCETISGLLTNVNEVTAYVNGVVREVMSNPEILKAEVQRASKLADRLVTFLEWVKIKLV